MISKPEFSEGVVFEGKSALRVIILSPMFNVVVLTYVSDPETIKFPESVISVPVIVLLTVIVFTVKLLIFKFKGKYIAELLMTATFEPPPTITNPLEFVYCNLLLPVDSKCKFDTCKVDINYTPRAK